MLAVVVAEAVEGAEAEVLGVTVELGAEVVVSAPSSRISSISGT